MRPIEEYEHALPGPDPSDRLHRIVMIGLGAAAAVVAALVFIGFAWAGA